MAAADHRAPARGPMAAPAAARPALARRLLWFVALWVAGVAAVTVVGLIIKLMLKG